MKDTDSAIPEDNEKLPSKGILKGLLNEIPNPFWSEVNGIHVSVSELFEFLSERGFRQYDVSKKMRIPNLVKLDGNIIEDVTIGSLVGEIRKYLMDINKRYIFDYIIKSGILIRPENLLLLDDLEENFLEDNISQSYIPFKNGILQIAPDELNIIPYEGYEKLIWRSQIRDHDITIRSEDDVNESSVFKSFIEDITSHDSDASNSRYNHLRSLIGYLINTHKDRSNAKAVVLMDENLTGYPNGGTGKSLLANAISKIRKSIQEDGKNFDSSKSFAFQQVDADTRLLFLDDLKRGFDFEKIFPFITEGIQVEKKYQDRYTIPFDKSPKLLLTTNYALQGFGESYKRRLLEFEVSSFFNESNTPYKKYEQLFFDDWDMDQWNLFFSCMIYCCQLYLKDGIIKSKPLTLDFQKVRETIGRGFADYFNEKLKIGKEYEKNKMFYEIKNQIPACEKIGQRVVTSKLKTFAEMMKINLKEWHSGSNNFFMLKKPH